LPKVSLLASSINPGEYLAEEGRSSFSAVAGKIKISEFFLCFRPVNSDNGIKVGVSGHTGLIADSRKLRLNSFVSETISRSSLRTSLGFYVINYFPSPSGVYLDFYPLN